MPKLKSFTIKRNEIITVKEAFKPIPEKEQFYIIQASYDWEQFKELRKVLYNFSIKYQYLGIRYGFHNYNITIRKLTDMYKEEVTFRYTGNTDHSDNPLNLYSILYEIAEIYCSDESNPCWSKDKKIQSEIKNLFTDKEIEVFPTELI